MGWEWTRLGSMKMPNTCAEKEEEFLEYFQYIATIYTANILEAFYNRLFYLSIYLYNLYFYSLSIPIYLYLHTYIYILSHSMQIMQKNNRHFVSFIYVMDISISLSLSLSHIFTSLKAFKNNNKDVYRCTIYLSNLQLPIEAF